MKKTVVVAALVAAMVLPTSMPASAAMMDNMKAKAGDVPVICFLLPLLPKCIAAWKDENSAMMEKMGERPMMMKWKGMMHK